GLGATDQFFRRTVKNADAAVAVDADHARAGAGEYRFGETPPAIDEVVRAHDIVALRAQFLGHAIERFAELCEIALRPMYRYTNVQIAGRDDVGRSNQAPDRCHQTVGEVQSDPDRG